MEKFFQSLKRNLVGEIRHDPLSRKIYSVDASIYEVEPLVIVIPQSQQDLLLAMQIAADHEVPITPRGAATGITGSCLGKGLIIDCSQHLNHILEINLSQEYALCEPGVIQDQLNHALSPFGYRLGPDTSTGNRATLGGMLANNAAGARSLYYGKMSDHVKEVELALFGGKTILCSSLDETAWKIKRSQNNYEGRIYREIFRILDQYRHLIKASYPKIPRHVSGYNLDALLSSPLNLCQLIAGSEGTLGIATKIKVHLAKKLKHTGLCIIHLHEMILGLRVIEEMLSHQPISLEMIDDKILSAARLSPTVRNKIDWLIGSPQAVFVAEFSGETESEVQNKLSHFSTHLKSLHLGYAHVLLDNPKKMAQVWEVRKAGLGLLLSKRSYNRAIAFIEDLSVAPEKLANFMEEFIFYLKERGKEAGIYGHIGSGCMHIRPYIDLRSDKELDLMQRMMEDISSMVLKHGGAMSGEHGDGLIRSWLNEKMFGKELYQAFCELKAAFDPQNLMNPGKIVHPSPLKENLRMDPKTPHISLATFLDFTSEGGIELAADLCNGNGECRKREGVMCPSFQVSGDEYDTTRARAQSLRSIIHGRLPIQELTGDALIDVLDLCIECKGCKQECPSQVDMAKMKAEVLYQYQEKNGYSLRNRLFAHIRLLNRLSAPFATSFNWLTSSQFGKIFLDRLGITPHRDLPHLASERFSHWFRKQKQIPRSKKVLLFSDTYTEFNQPEIGKAAYKILSALGYEIILFEKYCCGRPLISKGFLRQARKHAIQLIEALSIFAEKKIPLVVLEPSCASAFLDDFKGLIGQDHLLSTKLNTLVSECFTFDSFLYRHLDNNTLPLNFIPTARNLLLHTHCHQKTLSGALPTLELLNSIPGFNATEIASGCCGLAGAFGYEKEHYQFSLDIGNLKLLPIVKQAPEATWIVANGMSCRSQIEHGSCKKAWHLAEAIASAL